jgi:ABC-type antimicrobial peptide transport system permease subunit
MSRNKVRTFLTMLGIIIGVASVIAMLAIGQGAKNAVRDQISSLGANVVMVMPGAFSPGGVRQEAGSASRLTEKDAVLIKLHCPSVRYASPQVRTVTQVKYLNQNWRTSIQGVYPEFLSIRDWPVDRGAAFTESEQRTSAKIACWASPSPGTCSARTPTRWARHCASRTCPSGWSGSCPPRGRT